MWIFIVLMWISFLCIAYYSIDSAESNGDSVVAAVIACVFLFLACLITSVAFSSDNNIYSKKQIAEIKQRAYDSGYNQNHKPFDFQYVGMDSIITYDSLFVKKQ